MVRQRPDVLGNRHVVVIEDHEQIRRQRSRMVERLEGDAGGHCAVADHRHDAAVVAGVRRRHRHAERCGDRGARMSYAERVVLALRTGGERRKSAVLLDGVQPVAAPGEHFVRVGLVTDVPDQPVARGVEHVVQSDRQLDRAEARGEMAAARADAVDQELAQLACQRRELACGQAAQIRRAVDRPQQGIGVGGQAHQARQCTRGRRARRSSTGAAQLARLMTKSASSASGVARPPSGSRAAIAVSRSSRARARAAGRPAALG